VAKSVNTSYRVFTYLRPYSHLLNSLRQSTATAESHDDDEDAGSQTTFFCSLSITGLIWQHMNAKLPPGIISTNTHKKCTQTAHHTAYDI